MTQPTGSLTKLGRTGLTVSRLCLGTVNFGGRVDEPDARRLLDYAIERGINIVDTANMYGWRVHKGFTEELIGRWLADRPSMRDEIVLATKVGNPVTDGPNDQGLSARHIIAACDASLRRLGTDWIDLYQMHRADDAASWDEIWQAMDTLVAQGKIRYVGSSNFAGWRIAAAQEAAHRRQALGIVSEQCLYNLVTRHAELEVIPAAEAYGVGVFAWSPLHGGLLGGVIGKLAAGTAVKSAQGRAVPALEIHHDAIERYEAHCANIGRSPAEVGLAWTLARQGVTGVVIGPRTTDHIDDALRALANPLDEATTTTLESLFPPVGAGGQGPHAWLS
ncbi:aldo/keto reductase [Haloechinothrix salitolerans]|uniref:Aldo/keto reductase n=1 Tax=Haloechinothrix salitolerans TaxID=926830 RepID=A0ABW2BUR1_9PSEU